MSDSLSELNENYPTGYADEQHFDLLPNKGGTECANSDIKGH